DGVALDAVARALRRVAPGHDLVEDLGKDAAAAGKRRAVRGPDGVGVVAGLAPQAEGVDLERADEARVEALEVEHDDVLVEPGARLENVAALGSHLVLAGRGDAGGDDSTGPELGEVEKVDGSDRRRDPIERHAREPAPLNGELHELELLEDLRGEAGIGEVVLDE